MKKQMKRIIAIVCTLALAITSFAFTPTTSMAADTWIKCTKTTTSPEASPSTADYTHWRFKKNDSNGAMEYCWINQDADPNDLSKVKFRKTYDGIGNDGKPLDLSWAWNTAEIWKYGEDADHPLENNAVYSGSITIRSSMATETTSYGDCKLGLNIFGSSFDTTLQAGNNTINFSDVTYIGDDVTHPEFKKIVLNLIQLPKNCEITVTNIQMQKDADPFSKATQNVDFVPKKDGVSSPWTLRANYDGSSQYGDLLYKFDTTQSASSLSGLLIKTAGSVGEQEKDAQGNPVSPANRWWWVSGVLKNYASTAGLVPFGSYTGTIVLNIDKATDTDCKLFVYVDGKEFPFSLSAGENTLEIPEFMFLGAEEGASDVKFLFDELPKNAIVSVSSVEFDQASSDGWTLVPNKTPDFEIGPWNMIATYEVSGYNEETQQAEGIFGVLQYKENVENPQDYSDYSMRVVSNSPWFDESGDYMWSCLARLEDYCSDYLDVGDPYSITMTVDSSKPTIKTASEDDVDQLLVLVGSDIHKVDLVKGKNTFTLTGTYHLGEGTNKHDQIMLELDGVQQGTELTVDNIEFNSYPNKGWTNVPKNTSTTVGPWIYSAQEDEEHWSKLAYKENTQGTGLGAYDLKLRRLSPNGEFGKVAAVAALKNYLTTAKDTKNRPLVDGVNYDVIIEMTASGAADSVTNYGPMRIDMNNQVFDINVKKGKNTYNLTDLCGHHLTYSTAAGKNQGIQFILDEMVAKSVLNISNIQFVGPNDESQGVPNGTAFKPDGTQWTLYALFDNAAERYGAMRYEVVGNPANVSSVKMTMQSVSGWLDAQSIKATLNGYLKDLVVNKRYKIVAKVNIDESKVAEEDKNPTYEKKLRMTVDDQNYDFNVVNGVGGVYTFETEFTYTGTKQHVAFDFDQLLKGSIVYFQSVEVTPVGGDTTTVKPTTTQPTTTTNPTTVAPSSETGEQPTSETSSVGPQTSGRNVTTSVAPTVKTPGKAKIKKIYKKKKSAKKLKLKLKKMKGVKRYQIAVYKSKKKAKKNKKALVKKYVKYKKKITIKSKKLKKKKKLYVRARAYVLDSNSIKIFGKWSKIKKVKIKKK